MHKKIPIQDMISKDRPRSIRDITMADVGRIEPEVVKPKHRGTEREVKKVVHVPLRDETTFEFHSDYKTRSRKPRWGMIGFWFVVIITLIGAGFFVSSFFHSAKVSIKIKEVTTDVDLVVNLARKDDSNSFPFEIMNLNKEMSETVPANGEKQVSDKATGKVIIYNKNTTSQKLLAQTRLEAPNGKIYRLASTVTIAGSKKGVAGSLEVTALADAPGESYNSSLVDLTLPGFKGTAKYQTVYARSKTPFAGGASGTVKVAKKEDVAKAESILKDSLEKQLLGGVSQQIPNSFILLPNIYVIKFASTTQGSKDDSVVIKQKADLVGVLVDSQKMSTFLAKSSIPGFSGEDVYVDNLKDLSFEYSTSTTSLNINTDKLSIKIKGKPHFVYGYEALKLKNDLIGTSRESFATIIATYPAIEKGKSEISPFWRSKFPTDIAKITINEEK